MGLIRFLLGARVNMNYTLIGANFVYYRVYQSRTPGRLNFVGLLLIYVDT
jgi:hypothetical protein